MDLWPLSNQSFKWKHRVVKCDIVTLSIECQHVAFSDESNLFCFIGQMDAGVYCVKHQKTDILKQLHKVYKLEEAALWSRESFHGLLYKKVVRRAGGCVYCTSLVSKFPELKPSQEHPNLNPVGPPWSGYSLYGCSYT